MIELLQKDGSISKINTSSELLNDKSQIRSIQLIDYSEAELDAIATRFLLDLTFFKLNDDIEISSHFHPRKDQLAFNFSIPFQSEDYILEEQQAYFVIKEDIMFSFLKMDLERSTPQDLKLKYESKFQSIDSLSEVINVLIAFVTDYYADLTEYISKKIKALAIRTLRKHQFEDSDLDIVTELNFSNILIKESLREFQMILILLKKSQTVNEKSNTQINEELNDLAVVAEHIQYNFDRLDDLKENITSKIDLEQNRIFKLLTIITVCISLPTLVAGFFGMNFINIPGVSSQYGYIYATGLLLASFLIPFIIFKRKKWF